MEELKKFRKKQGKTRAEMAHILGVSRSFYEKIEMGDRNVSSNFLSKLKEKFPYVDVNIFFDKQSHEKCDI